MRYIFDWNEYKKRAADVVREGCVLLKNDRGALPLTAGKTVSVFGRIQLDYWYMKSGTGSGGMVNAPYAIGVAEGLNEAGYSVNEALLAKYRAFEEAHPFDKGTGWAKEPFFQTEMPVDDALAAEAAAVSDAAIVIFGRWCGEDHDMTATGGSYYLTADEEALLAAVTKAFPKTIVLLNIGSVIDMSWVKKYDPAAVMYIWQGGQEGGRGVADLLLGKTSPSGKLSDTIAASIDDYPSTANFGSPVRNIYTEDIYVGYRYFETFAKEKVLYPFGFGLSYTTFEQTVTGFTIGKDTITVTVEVMNTGDAKGKETVEVYYCVPEDAVITGAARNLAGFAKTAELAPGDRETVTVSLPVRALAVYDDGGVTGFAHAFVLEKGRYEIYAGSDVRSAVYAGSYSVPAHTLVQQCEAVLSPVVPFERLVNRSGKGAYEDVPLRDYDLDARFRERRPESVPCTGDKGIRLADVKAGKASMEDFLAQIPDEELIYISRGEGMCSPKVTPGIAGAIGGVTDGLRKFGIPVAGVSDGPSGIRMDNGTMAFSNPNGTLIACTFNLPLIRFLYEYQGMELRHNRIDSLLGPGMNIHRNPLNGRNFEYFSEDPYLTGKMTAAELEGMAVYGVTGTIKHFACNNEEVGRGTADTVVSERALREVYLKPYEIAVKEGKASMIMTMYGLLNGIHAASNYDLNETLLRRDWGFRGLVMTDWCAAMNDEYEPSSQKNTAAMIRARNDVYMVTPDALTNAWGDNAETAFREGNVTRGELVRNAADLCGVLMELPCMDFAAGAEDTVVETNRPASRSGVLYELGTYDLSAGSAELDVSGIHTEEGSGNVYTLQGIRHGDYDVEVTLRSDLGNLAQVNIALFLNGTVKGAVTLFGTEGKPMTEHMTFDGYSADQYMKLYFAQSGASVDKITITRKGTRA